MRALQHPWLKPASLGVEELDTPLASPRILASIDVEGAKRSMRDLNELIRKVSSGMARLTSE